MQNDKKQLKKKLKQRLVHPAALKSDKPPKNLINCISQNTYSSPVCYASKREEMRADFQDE